MNDLRKPHQVVNPQGTNDLCKRSPTITCCLRVLTGGGSTRPESTQVNSTVSAHVQRDGHITKSRKVGELLGVNYISVQLNTRTLLST